MRARQRSHLAGLPGLGMAYEAGSASPGLDGTQLHQLSGQLALAVVGLDCKLPDAHALEGALSNAGTQLTVDLGPDKPDLAICQQPAE